MGNLFDPKNPNTWPQNYKQLPTEAFTNVGQTPRDLAQSQVKNRFATDAQTPVYNAGGRLSMAGMQTPYENFNLAPGNVAQAASIAMGPGIAKDIFNGTYLFGKTVVHGSPQRGLTKIDPKLGSSRFPEDSIAYGWNPTSGVAKRDPEFVANAASDFADGYKTGYYSDTPDVGEGGSIYVGKVPRNGILIDPEKQDHMVLSSKPIRVKSEYIQERDLLEDPDSIRQYQEALRQALRRNGVGVADKEKQQLQQFYANNVNSRINGVINKMKTRFNLWGNIA